MSRFPPSTTKQWIKTLKRLGFRERRVGRGKHVNKFKHPTRHTKDSRLQRDFIIIPHKMYPVLSGHLVKGLLLFGFTIEEIELASKGKTR